MDGLVVRGRSKEKSWGGRSKEKSWGSSLGNRGRSKFKEKEKNKYNTVKRKDIILNSKKGEV